MSKVVDAGGQALLVREERITGETPVPLADAAEGNNFKDVSHYRF
jgi:hypothetical protein